MERGQRTGMTARRSGIGRARAMDAQQPHGCQLQHANQQGGIEPSQKIPGVLPVFLSGHHDRISELARLHERCYLKVLPVSTLSIWLCAVLFDFERSETSHLELSGLKVSVIL